MENTIVGQDGALFSRRGDFGSLVINEYVFVVALLFEGNQNSPIAYFTHHTALTQNIL